MIIEELALHYVTRRDRLKKTALDFYRGGEEGELPERRRKNALQQVSNILNSLKRKHLIHIIPRRFVINIPRTLYLYHISLPKDVRRSSNEPYVEKYSYALQKVALAYQGNLGVDFPLSDALKIAKEVVKSYYIEFYGYLVVLDQFTDKASKMLYTINRPDVNEHFNRRAIEVISQYLLDIIAGRGYDDFIAEIVKLVREIVGYKLVEEVAERWIILSSKIRALTHDPDSRIASYARQFLKTSADADIFMSFPPPVPANFAIRLNYQE